MGNSDTKIGWPVVDMSGKTIIVTGANSGIGFETAKHIAFLGGRVILACRSEIRAEAATLRMRADFMEWKEDNPDFQNTFSNRKSSITIDETTSNTINVVDELQVEYMHLDLASLQSVVDFAEEFKSKGYSLDRLICNAGIAGVPQDITNDGFEKHFQTNYLGHFLLILRLLPLMRSSDEECRIIHVSSQLHESGEFDIMKLLSQYITQYDALGVYSNSKLFQVMLMYSLEKRLSESNITTYCVAPPCTDTKLTRRLMSEVKGAANIFNNLGKPSRDIAKAVARIIDLAVHPRAKDFRGYYFNKGTPITPSPKSRNDKCQQVLWNYSLESVQKYITPELLDGLSLPD